MWGGAGDCRYFLDNERFILAETGADAKRKLFVWDRWRDSTHVIGEYAAREGAAAGFSHAGLRPTWDRVGAHVAFASTHSGQGWQARLQSGLTGLSVESCVAERSAGCFNAHIHADDLTYVWARVQRQYSLQCCIDTIAWGGGYGTELVQRSIRLENAFRNGTFDLISSQARDTHAPLRANISRASSIWSP